MKARTDCFKCRQEIREEEKQSFLKREYAYFKDSAYSMACFAICGVLTAMVRRGRTAAYIKQLYDDMCFTFSTPQMFGKEITMTAVMKSLTQNYGIDWDKLEVHIEDEKSFIHDCRKGEK